MSEETNTKSNSTQPDLSKTTPEVKPVAGAADDKGGDDLEALKRHNKALLTELSNKKGELNDYKGKFETLQAEKESREADELKKQGQFKELLEKEQAKNESFQKQIVKAQLQAFAFKEGIIDDDLIDVIPIDKIKVTTVNDSIQVSGAEEAVKAYKASKPHLFKALDATASTGAAADNKNETETGKATGAAVTDPNSAGNTTNAIDSGVKPGSKEAKELEKSFLEKYSK